mmetsp:Transcript_3567/g.8244  ORF Transcript_3567/g.8244 Transcript_3567/m.8244 type:complete len:200 (-) Transcript_3567:154-753(-)
MHRKALASVRERLCDEVVQDWIYLLRHVCQDELPPRDQTVFKECLLAGPHTIHHGVDVSKRDRVTPNTLDPSYGLLLGINHDGPAAAVHGQGRILKRSIVGRKPKSNPFPDLCVCGEETIDVRCIRHVDPELSALCGNTLQYLFPILRAERTQIVHERRRNNTVARQPDELLLTLSHLLDPSVVLSPQGLDEAVCSVNL